MIYRATSNGAKNIPWSREILLAERGCCLRGCIRQPCKKSSQSCESCIEPDNVMYKLRVIGSKEGLYIAVERVIIELGCCT